MSHTRILIVAGQGERFSSRMLRKLNEMGYDVVRVDADSTTTGAQPDRVILDDIFERRFITRQVKAEPDAPRLTYGPERNYRKGKSRRW